MARKTNLLARVHKVARGVYRANRATRTAQVLASGNPKRIARLYGRRLYYSFAARLANKLFN